MGVEEEGRGTQRGQRCKGRGEEGVGGKEEEEEEEEDTVCCPLKTVKPWCPASCVKRASPKTVEARHRAGGNGGRGRGGGGKRGERLRKAEEWRKRWRGANNQV